MKEYPLTKTELWSLGGVGVASGIFYSIASFCFSTWWDLQKNFAFDKDLSPTTSGYWHGIEQASLIGGIVFIVVGLLFTFVGGLNVIRIINDTDHDN